MKKLFPLLLLMLALALTGCSATTSSQETTAESQSSQETAPSEDIATAETEDTAQATEAVDDQDADELDVSEEHSYLMWDGIFLNNEYDVTITTQDMDSQVYVTISDARLIPAIGTSEASYTLDKEGYDGYKETAAYLEEFDGTGDFSVISVRLYFSGGNGTDMMIDGNNICVEIFYAMTNGDFIMADSWGYRDW